MPDNLFKSCAFFAPFFKLSALKLTYLPAFFARIAFVANVVANLAPAPPGKPICINASVSLPTALCSAISSKGFKLSKNVSTFAAVLVSAPKSISSAPNDTTPSTVLIKPDPTAAENAAAPPTSLGSSKSILVSSNDVE